MRLEPPPRRPETPRRWTERLFERHGRAIFACTCVLVLLVGVALRPRPERRGWATATAGDVRRFVAAFGDRTPEDTACAYLEPFLREASTGQRAYMSKFDVDRPSLCRAIRRDSTPYVRLASEMAAFDSAAHDFDMFVSMADANLPFHPMPDVYFVVGNGISAGSTTRGRHPIILIGTERLKSLDRITWTMMHEVAHTQQDYPWLGSFTGGPAILGPLKGTLLRAAITEGAADYFAEQLTGEKYHNAYGEQHEVELWNEFRRDMHGKDYSRWLYNGANRAARGERPPDLGYFIGYSIVKAYAADTTRTALWDALHIRDFDRFLALSGYNPSAR